ncbi:MAG TPA: transglycosylase SLT domain-containing protein [Chloroflexota bacterium]|nr:transglycosylase SLT domain-containing protein [Chloroflexota bacterium]
MTRALLLALILLSLATPAWAQADEVPELIIPAELIDELIVGEVQEAPQEAPPTPAPAPIARPLTIPELIDAAAYRWGVSAALMRRITWCESRWNPWAVSPWGDRGIAQFNRITWQEQAPLAGLPANFDAAFDPVMSLELMARLVSRGQSWRWRACL